MEEGQREGGEKKGGKISFNFDLQFKSIVHHEREGIAPGT